MYKNKHGNINTSKPLLVSSSKDMIIVKNFNLTIDIILYEDNTINNPYLRPILNTYLVGQKVVI